MLFIISNKEISNAQWLITKCQEKCNKNSA